MNRTKWNNQTVFCVGDTIKVHQNIIEGKKTRIQVFQGIVIGIKGHAGLTSFTVRKIATANVGVERIYPLNTPTIIKIEVVKKGKIKKAKLYHLRDRVGKKATKVKDIFVKKEDVQEIKLQSNTQSPEVDDNSEEKKEKEELKPLNADTKQAQKKEARKRRKSKKKRKIERKERKDIR